MLSLATVEWSLHQVGKIAFEKESLVGVLAVGNTRGGVPVNCVRRFVMVFSNVIFEVIFLVVR